MATSVPDPYSSSLLQQELQRVHAYVSPHVDSPGVSLVRRHTIGGDELPVTIARRYDDDRRDEYDQDTDTEETDGVAEGEAAGGSVAPHRQGYRMPPILFEAALTKADHHRFVRRSKLEEGKLKAGVYP